MDYLERAEFEYQQAVAAQEAENRKQVQAEGAKRKKEADKVYSALVEAFPQPEKPVAPPRSFRDMVRDAGEGVTKEQRERWRVADFHARRSAAIEQEMRQDNRSQENGAIDLPNYQGADIDIDSIPDEEEFEDDYYDGDDD